MKGADDDPRPEGQPATSVAQRPVGTGESGAERGGTATGFSPPTISLPKGGGAIRGMGEKFAANPVTGTASLSVPIQTSPGRSGFGPQFSLSYDSGAGNGPFGFGWSLSLPSIIRKTDKGLPLYRDAEESDVFILSGAEDLVPALKEVNGRWEEDEFGRRVGTEDYLVRRYRPRIEGLFARIERWTRRRDGDTHWRSISRDNVTTLYGNTEESRVADPVDTSRVYSWLICESYDDKGNAILYEYVPEDSVGVDPAQANEVNRTDESRSANRYLKRVKYGNRTPRQPGEDLTQRTDWLFDLVLDYGEHDPDEPTPDDGGDWLCRHDPFSSYRAGFEVRTYRLCQRTLLFHHFPDEEQVGENCLVRSTDFVYRNIRNNPEDLKKGYPIASFIASVTQSGYKRKANGGYLKKSLPPLEVEYSQATIQDEVRDVDPESLENLPYGLDSAQYQWVDLDGEGLSGILTEQADAWYYKRNLSPLAAQRDSHDEAVVARFAPVEQVARQPSPPDLDAGRRFLDLAGDGQLDLVQLSRPLSGYHERTQDGDWSPFVPFEQVPNLDWQDPNLKFVDLTGDGHADVLVAEDDVFTWYPSLAEAGFDAAEKVHQVLDEEKGPRLVFADGTNSIHLADLSGDGLTDLVRIRNGEVCYWPNLGYGRFGPKVTMDDAPSFDAPDLFDQRRIRLADIDGSGVTDIIYLGRDGVHLYFNRSGNSWSEARTLPQFPHTDNLSAVTVVDLLGNGTTCVVWSSPLPGDARKAMRYVDLMGGQKPHLLIKVANNLGAETHVKYAPSTRFYLADKLAGKPWITRLPFPVHVVERVETHDRINRNRFVTRYAYHHGYFDGVEREFRGFGMVEQWDTEDFAALGASDVFPDATNIDEASHVPPVLIKTWFHTGAYLDGSRISRQFENEYYWESDPSEGLPGLDDEKLRAMLLDDTILPDTIRLVSGARVPYALNAEEAREACRALKGSTLRQEIYALDGTDEEDCPYSVSEQNYTVELLQPRDKNRHAVLFSHPRETIDFHYERKLFDVGGRKLADPRVTHSMTLEVDDFGNVLQSVAIGYGRRHDDPDPLLSEEDREKQKRTLITYTEIHYTNPVVLDDEYRTPLPCETRSYELIKVAPEVRAEYLRPEDVRLEHAQEVLSFLNTAETPEQIAANVEISREWDVGVRVGQHILDRREELGGFTSLQQVRDVPQVGPERFTEIITTLSDAEALGVPQIPATALFHFEEMRSRVQEADDGGHDLPYEDIEAAGATENHPYRRLIEHVRTLYRRNDLTAPLPLGQVQSLALPFESYKLAFTPGLLSSVYKRELNGIEEDLLPDPVRILGNEGRYVRSKDHKALGWFPVGDPDDHWWIPSGKVFYSPAAADTPPQELAHARRHFFLPRRYRDPFHTNGVSTETFVSYDPYDLLAQETRDALGNRTTVGERNVDPTRPLVRHGHDYRVLQPALVMDPNRNRSTAVFDVLGMVAGTAVMGKPEDNPQRGDSLQGFDPDLTDAVVADHLRDPLASPHAILGRATTRLVYDLFAYHRTNDQIHPQPTVVYTLARETHDADLRAGEQTKIQHSFTYCDGFNREIQKKAQAEPGPVPRRDPTTGRIIVVNGRPEMTPDDASRRWVGSGWTVFNNKGKPVRQYEPLFTDTHSFEFEVLIGVSPVLFYDPVERVIATVLPNHTWEKVVFDPWRQETWDVSDTVLVADPKNDPDAGNFFRRIPDVAYLPTWQAQRQDGALGPQEQEAARKAAIYADTPTVAHLDSLGRTILTIAHNKFKRSDTPVADPATEEFYRTRVKLDIEGNQHEVLDDKDRVVMRNHYDMLGTRIHQASMEAGERWMLNDGAGQVIRGWDSRGHQFRTNYDQLRRPTESYLREDAGSELLVGRTIYGETWPNPEVSNLRGKAVQLFDQAGVATSDNYDLKGNLLRSRRQLAREYKTTLDWSTAVPPALEAPTYTSRTRYDALNRPIQLIVPHSDEPGTKVNVIQSVYNENNLLEQVHVWFNQNTEPAGWLPLSTADLHAVTDIDYDAKGQRTLINYGNGVRTTYDYDPLTFRLTHLLTRRKTTDFTNDCPTPPRADWPGCQVQNLRYTYDPAGNITHVRDDAQQAVFFRNRRVEPSAEYTYDAIYQLIEATGREHLGQVGKPTAPDEFNGFHARLDHPGDGNAMGTYVERFVYDAVGNILAMWHLESDPASPGWKRCYQYAIDSNRLLSTSDADAPQDPDNPCPTHYSPAPVHADKYEYDAHGNMTRMAHLHLLQWEYRNQLRATAQQVVNNGGTPEMTWYVYDAGGQRVRKVTEHQAAAGQTPRRMKERVYLGGFEIYRKYKNDGDTVALERETLHVMDDKQRVALVETRTQGDDGSPAQLVRYQFSNPLGSASLELNGDAQIISYEEYYPYGSTSYQAVRKQTEAPKRYRYAAKERDEETGLDYYGARYYAPWLGRWTSCDPLKTGAINLYTHCRNDPVNNVDVKGLWTEEGVINAFAKKYGDDDKAMIALFTVMSYFKLEQADFALDDYDAPNFEKGTIPIAKSVWAGSERSDENAAKQLYDVMLDYFPEFDLSRHGYRLAWDIPVGAGKTVVGAVGTVGLGAVALVDPEPATKIAAGGGAVVSASFTAEGFTQVFGIGPAGGWNPLQEAAGWYGRTVGGPEGELWARRGMGVAQFALGMAGGMARSSLGGAKFSLRNLRAWPRIGKDALKADIRSGSAALQQLYERWLSGKGVLQFGADDLVYGPSAGGSLRNLQQSVGGRLLTDLGDVPPGQSWTQFSIQTMERQLAAGGKIRFDLTHVEDLPGVLSGTGKYANTVTAQELRHLQANWSRFKGSVHFYRGGKEIAAPW